MKSLIAFLTIICTVLFFVSPGQLYAEDITYTYDALNRITEVQYSDGTTITYTYDEVGNRVAKRISKPTADVTSEPILVAELPDLESIHTLIPVNTIRNSEKLPSKFLWSYSNLCK